MTPEIRLTEGDDVYVHPKDAQWAHIFTLGGNDTVTTHGNGVIVAGPGNNTYTSVNEAWHQFGGSLAFWEARQSFFVDLEAGYALNPWGGRDTLVGIRNIHGVKHGARVEGSASADHAFLDLWRGNDEVHAFFDGKGGFDRASFYDWTSRDVTVDVSPDASSVVVSLIGGNRAVLANVEEIKFYNRNQSQPEIFPVSHFIDKKSIGQKTLITDSSKGWASSIGKSVSLTYSFAQAEPAYGGGEGGQGFVTPPEHYKQAVSGIFDRLSVETGLSFREVEDSQASFGQLRFSVNQQAATKGYAFIPGSVPDDRAGDVWLDVETLDVLQPGQEGWQVLLHEIGHALGLEHPVAIGQPAEGRSALLDAWNHNGFTVMSERTLVSDQWQSWFGPFDLQALQHLYGKASTGLNSENNQYGLSDLYGRSMHTIRDSGGYDVIDASALNAPALINLSPGSFSSVGVNKKGGLAFQNMFLDFSSSIEEVVGSRFDDVLIGSSENNAFRPGDGNDLVEGGGGQNIVILDHPRSSFNVQKAIKPGSYFVESKDGLLGNNQLTGIQYVWFSDQKLALAGAEADSLNSLPVKTAKLVGAAFGPSSLADLPLVGRVLSDYAQGLSSLQVASKWLASAEFLGLAKTRSHSDFVHTVFQNVVGIPAPEDLHSIFKDLLDSRTYTQESLLLLAADVEFNLLRVDVVGVAEQGLWYV